MEVLLHAHAVGGPELLHEAVGLVGQQIEHAQAPAAGELRRRDGLRIVTIRDEAREELLEHEVRAHLEFASDNEALEEAQKQLEIADRRVQDLSDFPEKYHKAESPEGPIWVSNTKYHVFDNHRLIAKRLKEDMQENFDSYSPYVQAAMLEHYNYHMEKAEEEAMREAQLAAAGGPDAVPVRRAQRTREILRTRPAGFVRRGTRMRRDADIS